MTPVWRSAAPRCGGCQLGPGTDVQLGEDVREVGLYRAPADEQALADLRIRQALGGQFDDLEFGRGQAVPSGGGPLAGPPGATGVGDSLYRRECRSFGPRLFPFGAQHFLSEPYILVKTLLITR